MRWGDFGIVFLAGILVACATPYQPWGFRGGYRESHLYDDIYAVSFEGNNFTSRAQCMEYAFRRGRELCAEKGFRDFRPVDVSHDGSLNMSPAGAFKVSEVTVAGQCVH